MVEESIVVTAKKIGGSIVVVIPAAYRKTQGINPGDSIRLQAVRVADGVLQTAQE